MSSEIVGGAQIHYLSLSRSITPCGIHWKFGETPGAWVNDQSVWGFITCPTCRKAIKQYQNQRKKRQIVSI